MSDAARADWQDSNSAQNRACNVGRRVWLKNWIDPGHRAGRRDVRGFAAIGKRLKSALTCRLRVFAQTPRRQRLIALVAMLARGMATGRARVGWAKTVRLPPSWIGAEVVINNFLLSKTPSNGCFKGRVARNNLGALIPSRKARRLCSQPPEPWPSSQCLDR